MIEVEFDARVINAALTRLTHATGDVSPALRVIGEALIESTKQRFATGTGPDGQRWDSNSRVTIERYLARKTGVFNDQGKRTGNTLT